MVIGFILVCIGILFLGITIVSYRKYNKVTIISISDTKATSFNIKDGGDYAICVEGVNHQQITLDMIELKNQKSNQNIKIESIEHLNLKNRYRLKFYHNIFKFSIDSSSAIKMIIPTYGALNTHHSKYKLVETYSIAKSPTILIHRFYPIYRRLQYFVFLIGCLFFIPIGAFLIFKG